MADVQEDVLPDQSATITLTDFLRSVIAASDSGIVTVQSILDLFQGEGTALTDIPSAAGDMDADDIAYGEEDGVPKKFTRPQIVSASSVDAAGAVMESDYNAHTVLAATADNTPAPITMGASTILARLAAGNIVAATPTELRTLLDVSVSGDTVLKSLYDANTILKADSDNTPVALTMGASTVLARLAAGNIVAATPAEMRTLLDVPTNAEAVLDTLFDANTILAANSDNTPVAVTVAEQRILGRKTGGNITALTGDEVRAIGGQGVIDIDTGATVNGTAAQTTLFNSSPMVSPAPTVGWQDRFRATGSIINLSGGAITSTITCQFGGQSAWTAFALSAGTIEVYQFEIDVTIYYKEVDANGPSICNAHFWVTNANVETLSTTHTRQKATAFTFDNTGAINWTLTAQHSTNSASMSTLINNATLERAKLAF